MKNRWLKELLCHANIVFAGVFTVLWAINLFNPHMQFLSGGPANIALILFCVSSILLSALLLSEQ